MKEVSLKLTRSIKMDSTRYCDHKRVVVDRQERDVRCEDCGSKVDAFDYILSWANQQHRYEMEVEYKKRELAKLQGEIDELKRSVSYVKRKSKHDVKLISNA